MDTRTSASAPALRQQIDFRLDTAEKNNDRTTLKRVLGSLQAVQSTNQASDLRDMLIAYLTDPKCRAQRDHHLFDGKVLVKHRAGVPYLLFRSNAFARYADRNGMKSIRNRARHEIETLGASWHRTTVAGRCWEGWQLFDPENRFL